MGFPIWAFLLSLGPWLAEAEEPELDVMYLRYKQQPIDTSPVFNRNWLRDLEVSIFFFFFFCGGGVSWVHHPKDEGSEITRCPTVF